MFINIRYELGPDRLRGLYAIAGNSHRHFLKNPFWGTGVSYIDTSNSKSILHDDHSFSILYYSVRDKPPFEWAFQQMSFTNQPVSFHHFIRNESFHHILL